MIRSHLNPNADHFGGFVHAREEHPVCYEWLKPCETVLAHAQREGPLRRRSGWQGSTASAGDLVQQQFARPHSLPSLGAGAFKTKLRNDRHAKKKTAGRDLWATGAPSANWAPPTSEELLWKHATNTALKAATGGCTRPILGNQGGNAVAEGRRRRAVAKAASANTQPRQARVRKTHNLADDVPVVEAWDSISQAPTVPSPRSNEHDWEVKSAETATQSQLLLQPHERWDRDIAAHLGRNRSGWYDWHASRILG